MEKLMTMFKEMYGNFSDELTTEQIIKAKPKVKEIANYCKTFGLFEKSKEQYENFVKSVDEVKDKEKRLCSIWNFFDTKVSEAPTQFHAQTAMIILFPVVDHVLDSFELVE